MRRVGLPRAPARLRLGGRATARLRLDGRATAVILVSALALTGCVSGGDSVNATGPNGQNSDGSSTGGAEPSEWVSTTSSASDDLPRLAGPYSGETLVADGVVAPTNSWISGALFNGGDQPVFPGVLAVKPETTGFSVGLPIPHATDKTVFGSFVPDVPVTLASDAYVLQRTDDLSATFRFLQDGAPVGDLTLAEGWPYAAYVAANDQEVDLGAVVAEGDTGGVLTVGATTYEFVTSAPLTSAGSVDLGEGDSIVLFAQPTGASADELDVLRSGALPLVSTRTDYEISGGLASTTFSYDVGGDDTVFAARPHQTVDSGDVSGALDAGYSSIYGPLGLHSGTSFGFSVPELAATPTLDISGLDDAQRAELTTQVTADAGAVHFDAPDSYYGGKALYRASQVYGFARDLGLTDVAATLKQRMLAEFDLWFDAAGCIGRSEKCFVYDDVLGGVTGLMPAYGSDEFNDHHFHYGYFLYALGVMAIDDPTIVDDYRTMADVLSLDIASPATTEAFPVRRSFDDWTGHSWASGTSPFADGNNQESASEAVTAWAGLSLWARASDNTELSTEATWLFSTESAVATRYWLGADLPEGFTSPFFALNWAGKRDYATFFDATPSAILGVELLPMSPSTQFLPTDEATVRAQVEDAITTPTLELPLVDYSIMYLATIDADAALELARTLPDSRVDNADTRSYLLAWIFTRQAA